MKKYFFIMAILLSVTDLSGQLKETLQPLSIGEAVPDISLGTIVNYHQSTARLSDFKGKLLILDFWATWCTGCLANFPKMEALQKTFGGKLQVLAIAYQDKQTITAFFASKAGRQYNMSSVVRDSLLSILFPHRLIPHYVWIDGTGVLRAITGADEVTAPNIKAMLHAETPALAVKRDLEGERPLFISTDISMDDQVFYAVLRKGSFNGLGSGTRFRKYGEKVIGRAFTNLPLLLMYQSIARELFEQRGDVYSDKRIILELKDPAPISPNRSKKNDGTYDTGNFYNYEFIVPASRADSLYQYMFDHLNRYTEYQAVIEKRKVKCFVLIKKDTTNIETGGGVAENTLFYKKPYHLQNCPVAYLVNMLNDEKIVTLPIIDETNLCVNIDIELSGNTSMAVLRQDLNKYGLELVSTERDLNMLVINDDSALQAGMR